MFKKFWDKLFNETEEISSVLSILETPPEPIKPKSDEYKQMIAYLSKQVLQLYNQGRYEQAIDSATQCLELVRQSFDEQHPEFATSLNTLAELYKSMGKYVQAEPLFRQSIEIRRIALGEQHPDFATSLNDLATLYDLMGKYAQAEPLYRQSIEILRIVLGEQHPDFATSLNNLAVLYHSMGKYAQAERLYRQSIEIRRIALGEQHPDFAQSLNNLAALYDSMGNYVQAEPLFRQAIEIRRIVLGEQHPDFASSLDNLAGLYYSISNYAQAEPLYRQAMEITRIALGEQHPDFASSLNNLAALYKSMGNYVQAEPLFRQATEIKRIALGEQHPNFAISLNHLAELYIATNRALEGFKLMEQALVIEDRMIGQVFSISSESQRAAYLKTIGWNLYLSLVTQYLSDSPDAVRSALKLILRRKAIQAEALASQRDLVLGGKYPELEPTLRKAMTLRTQIAQKTMAGPGKEDLKTHEQILTGWNSEKEKLEAELARQIPEMNLEQKLRAIDRQTVAMAMPVDSILVEFARFTLFDFKAVPARGERRWKPARYLAFTIITGEPDNIQMIDLGEAEPIDQMIATFRSTITGEAEDQSSRGLGAMPLELQSPAIEQARDNSLPGSALRKALFDPLISIIGNRKRILISPDGDLTRLPFEVLPMGNNRLIDLYQISYLGAGRDLVRYGVKTGRQASSPLVIADPDFDLSGIDPVVAASSSQQSASAAQHRGHIGHISRDFDRSGMSFGRLPGTQLEGIAIAAMLGVKPVLESDALEAKLKTCQSPKILHIATHGFFLADQKRDPNEEHRGLGALAFNQADGGMGSMNGMGRLTATRMENPLLRSGLALAGVNSWLKHQHLPAAAEDGILTAEDVSGLDLLDTDLVVLSACETGLGEVRVGEGVFGLRRAFVLAGAKTLVMSLWKVPDEQTKTLMEDFYRRILSGEPRDRALREAQLSLKAKYSDPLYWGAFICQGDSNPIPRS